jgi:hypothetical protein
MKARTVYTAASEGGPITPVTRSTTESTYVVSYLPKDDRVLYTRHKGGDEHNHLNGTVSPTA